MRLIKLEPLLLVLLIGWVGLAIAALFLRPLMPVDETRYVAVAWEMWQRGDFLVPHLNGEPYSHKPPLLFWLMHAGWAVFGVNEWWPRMVSPLLSLVALGLTWRLATRLWPDQNHIALETLWVLLGCGLFAGLFTLAGFDPLLTCCVLMGVLGVQRAAQGESRTGMLWLGAGIGLGVLSKGPVILLHLLPVALLAPWWANLSGRMGRWYWGVMGAVLFGAAIALAWAIPAAYVGGEAYRNAIFWGQTAGRMTESFAHRAPFWFYLPLLPLMLFPWLFWPSLWRALLKLREVIRESNVRFLLAWMIPVFIGFTLISGKQTRYLLPLMPVFALLAVYLLQRLGDPRPRLDMLWPAVGFALMSGLWFYLRMHPADLELPEWATDMPQWPAWAFAGIGLLLTVVNTQSLQMRLRALSFSMLGLMATIYMGVLPVLAPYHDTTPVAQHIAQLQARGIPVAYWGKYHAQFNFSGRLTQPLSLLTNGNDVSSWVAAYPAGRVVTIDKEATSGAMKPELERLFRGSYLKIWEGRVLVRAQPDLRAR